MEKHYEAVKEILDDQIKKIVKKGDISPQELDSLYKASAIVLDLETKEAMKKAEEEYIDADFGVTEAIDGEQIIVEDENGNYIWER